MADSTDKPTPSPEPSYVLAERDYADIAHLENPRVIERILSATRTGATAYVGELLRSGVSRYVLAGPKVAFTAIVVEALTDLAREISAWRKAGRIPEDFSSRPSGYQTWVELLGEIDSNPVDADRLKALKAMFLAANEINATDGESILAYQLFQISKNLSSGQLLLLKATYNSYRGYVRGPRTGGTLPAEDWRSMMARTLGHGLSALVAQYERKLVEHGLIAAWTNKDEFTVPIMDARMTDLGISFCRNLESYSPTPEPDPST
jgi:hypothetical protein